MVGGGVRGNGTLRGGNVVRCGPAGLGLPLGGVVLIWDVVAWPGKACRHVGSHCQSPGA